MAGTSLLALIDDIATLLDDVSVMTKVAAKKTAGVLGDDLALNAEQVSGVRASRELPVVWAVAKGSAKNKLLLVPAALLISAFMPWLITPLLMIGGLFLCFEGCEKVAHKLFHREEAAQAHQAHLQAVSDDTVDLVAFENKKIKGAIRTDFILSAEIIVIALGAVGSAPFEVQVASICAIAALMTVGVYSLVAAIVKLDDAGLYLLKTPSDAAAANLRKALGKGILVVAPWLMKSLSVVGTLAMFLVGGGILVHSVPWINDLIALLSEALPLLAPVAGILVNFVTGIVAGSVVLLIVHCVAHFKDEG